jgi:hypothetical protein
LQNSVAPLWDNNECSEDETPSPLHAQDGSGKGNKIHLKEGFQQKCAKVAVDAEVAKQLLKDFLVDPLLYADFDHTPPMTQAQLNFLLSRLDGVSDTPLVVDDSSPPLEGASAHDGPNVEPLLDENVEKSFSDKGYGKFSRISSK